MNRFRSNIAYAFSWIRDVSLDPVGGLGVLLATFSAILFFAMVFLNLIGLHFSPYIGIFIYVVLPAILVIGLVLIPVGRWRLARAYPGGRLPRFDFGNPNHLRKFIGFLLLTFVNLVIFGVGAYQSYQVSESNEFCGKTCHTVMQPEWTAYQASPHSRVHCVECHIGPGADWYVRSKLSGARQVLAVLTRSYDTPIPTPIENLRPARETCEQCHWPEKFHGDRLQVNRHFNDDEENSETVNVLLLKIGGGNIAGEPVNGIHWHINPANTITYVSTDESRKDIPWVRLERKNGEVVDFVSHGAEDVDKLLSEGTRRTMDCMDCHNRPTHIYHLPDEAVDHAMAEGILDRSVPYLRREAVKALETPIERREDAAEGIRAALEKTYGPQGELAGKAPQQSLDHAVDVLTGIWDQNVFPKMKVTWGTYPNFLGHRDDGGCFRCHDGSHVSESGETIPDDCGTCHVVLAYEETDPKILQELYESQF